METSRPKEISQ